MFRSLYTAASGMLAEEANIQEIAENLANASTPAYKKGRVDFEDLMYSSLMEPASFGAYGESMPVSSEVGAGVKAAGIEHIFTPGELSQTGNSLDVGIQGDGFFKVSLGNGISGYTRNGMLHVNKEGKLVIQGHPVAGVQIPKDAAGIEIGEDGTIKAYLHNPNQREVIGHIQLTRFLNPAGLRMEENVYLESPFSGTRVDGVPGTSGLGTLAAGYIEKANINMVQQMMAIVLAQRIYEMNANAVKATDEMMRMTTQLKPVAMA